MDKARIDITNIIYYGQDNEKIKKIMNDRKDLFIDSQEIEKLMTILPLSGKINAKNEPPLNFDTTSDFCSALQFLQPNCKGTRERNKH